MEAGEGSARLGYVASMKGAQSCKGPEATVFSLHSLPIVSVELVLGTLSQPFVTCLVHAEPASTSREHA